MQEYTRSKMTVIDSFSSFVRRVKKAVEGGLNSRDKQLLDHLLININKRNLVLARGLLSAFNSKSPSRKEVQLLAGVLDDANRRIIQGEKEAFTKEDQKRISELFEKKGFSRKVSDWLLTQQDVFLYNEMSEMAGAELGETKGPKKVVRVTFESDRKKEKSKVV